MKHNTILAAVVITISFVVFSLPCMGQPKNLQVKITSIEKIEGKKVTIKGLTMQGDTVYIRYGFRSNSYARNVKPGQWVTIFADITDPKCTWTLKKIKFNK